MKNKEELQKELEQLAPRLSKLKEKLPEMEVPKNYFHNLPIEISHQLADEMEAREEPMTRKEKGSWFEWLFRPSLALAFASMILLAVVTFLIVRQPDQHTPQSLVSLEEIPTEEIMEYIESNIQDFESSQILDAAGLEANIWSVSDIQKDDIEKYLEENLDELDENTLENLF